MGRALSSDLRVCVLKASQAGLSARGAAARFGVAPSTAIRLIRAKAERTVSTLWNTVGDIIGLFEPHERANYFAPAGYDTS